MPLLGDAEIVVICSIIAVLTVVMIIPYTRIFGKAGFSPWLGLLMVVPVVNIIMLYFLAFSNWPGMRRLPPGA